MERKTERKREMWSGRKGTGRERNSRFAAQLAFNFLVNLSSRPQRDRTLYIVALFGLCLF